MTADKTMIVSVSSYDVKWVEAPDVSAEEASNEKGYAHPGSSLSLPGGYRLPMQYGMSPLTSRNGLLEPEILQALVERLSVYQAPENPMRSRETALAITKIEEAIHWLNHRQIDRQRREVRFTDKS